MIRKNLKTLIITSVIILLPIVVGLILWNTLPEQIPIHWNAAGEVDGYSSKAFFVFGLPLIMLAFQWLCVVVIGADPKKANHTEKIMNLVLWIMPVLVITLSVFTYMTALGHDVRMEVLMPILLGLMFVIIGNYLPKCKQSYTIGIKIPWTLDSEENWNKTHRFAGIVWVLGGILIMVTSPIGSIALVFSIALVMVAVPIIYSYCLHRKGI